MVRGQGTENGLVGPNKVGGSGEVHKAVRHPLGGRWTPRHNVALVFFAVALLSIFIFAYAINLTRF